MKWFYILVLVTTMISVFSLTVSAQDKLGGDYYTDVEKKLLEKRNQILGQTLEFDREPFMAWYEKIHGIRPPEYIIRQAQRAWNDGLVKDIAQLSYLLGTSLAFRGQYARAIKALEEAKWLDPINPQYAIALATVQTKIKPRN